MFDSNADPPTCASLDLNTACTASAEADSLCSDDTLIPWNRIFLCVSRDVDAWTFPWLIVALCVSTVGVMWIGVNLLSKIAEMYFAPALQDLCLKWQVPKRTAAALFVALANGAPDLAATGYMFKQGQGDMAFGSLLGASAYVCMNVIGMIILMKPHGPMDATPALVRDVASYLALLLAVLPVFINGSMTWTWVLVLNGLYTLLTCAVFCGDRWHSNGRPNLFARATSESFEPLFASDASGSESASDGFEPLEQWPGSPPQHRLDTIATYVQESSTRMHTVHEARMRTQRQAFGDGSPPALTRLGSSLRQHSVHSPAHADHDFARVNVAVGDWDVSTAEPAGEAGGESGTLPTSGAASADASTSASQLIHPGDSISQQQGPPPGQVLGASLESMPLELEVAMPVRHVTSWAMNDSLRVLGMVFPPCADTETAEDPPTGSDDWPGDLSHGARPPPQAPLGTAVQTAVGDCGATCMPIMHWCSEALEVPDYVAYLATPRHERHAMHGPALLLMLPGMLLMRLSIPTIAGDFYDPGIFVASSALAPLVAGPLYGLNAAAWLQGTATLASTAVALLFVAWGGFGVPPWLNRESVMPRLCMLAFSGFTLFMAVGWIQLVAGELVGCMQALGNLIKCPPVLLGFTLAAVNSLGDQATNLSVARASGKRAAFAACFSGMAFNLCVASAYGWILYTQKMRVNSVPLHITGPTWLLWGSCCVFLVWLLGVMAWMWMSTRDLCIPYQAGRICQLVFVALLIVFVSEGAWQWFQH